MKFPKKRREIVKNYLHCFVEYGKIPPYIFFNGVKYQMAQNNIVFDQDVLANDIAGNKSDPVPFSNPNIRSDKIIDYANYFVQLYHMISGTLGYPCSRVLIEKLLSIVYFKSIHDTKKPIFVDTMFVNQCGTGFSLEWYYEGDIIISNVSPSNLPIPEDALNYNVQISPKYKSNISDSEKAFLKDVFLEFGGYSAKTIGLEINKFVDKISSSKNDNSRPIVDIQRSSVFFTSEETYLDYNDNMIIAFVFSYCRY